eukprot:1156014-Pelagomonas_calceolata.AAC.1
MLDFLQTVAKPLLLPLLLNQTATVASKAAEFWAQLQSKGGCFKCPQWMKLAELVLVMVSGSAEDERMFPAGISEKAKSMEYDLIFPLT